MNTKYDQAKSNPSAQYESPENVLTDSELTQEEKVGVLIAWRDEAVHLQESTAEGMGGGERSQIEEIVRALNYLQGLK